jgi:nucleotide-binding universal stress UspA family protein
LKILIAADGSAYTRAAARYIARHRAAFASPLEIHILHVQPPIPYPGAAAVAGKDAVDGYQREQSLKALAVAEKELAKAGIAFESAWRVGDVVDEIQAHCRARHVDLVVTGSHGLGALASLAMGSVATKLIASLTVPILVITREAAAHANQEQARSHAAA